MSLGERVVATVDGTKFKRGTNRDFDRTCNTAAPVSDRTGAEQASSCLIKCVVSQCGQRYKHSHMPLVLYVGTEHLGTYLCVYFCRIVDVFRIRFKCMGTQLLL